MHADYSHPTNLLCLRSSPNMIKAHFGREPTAQAISLSGPRTTRRAAFTSLFVEACHVDAAVRASLESTGRCQAKRLRIGWLLVRDATSARPLAAAFGRSLSAPATRFCSFQQWDVARRRVVEEARHWRRIHRKPLPNDERVWKRHTFFDAAKPAEFSSGQLLGCDSDSATRHFFGLNKSLSVKSLRALRPFLPRA